jgi:hypothetical protein
MYGATVTEKLYVPSTGAVNSPFVRLNAPPSFKTTSSNFSTETLFLIFCRRPTKKATRVEGIGDLGRVDEASAPEIEIDSPYKRTRLLFGVLMDGDCSRVFFLQIRWQLFNKSANNSKV